MPLIRSNCLRVDISSGALNCNNTQPETLIGGQQPQVGAPVQTPPPTGPQPSSPLQEVELGLRKSTTQVRCTVPHGVQAGEKFAVTMPNGRQVLAVLPPGVIPGQTVEISV